jgi:hypothetical protein
LFVGLVRTQLEGGEVLAQLEEWGNSEDTIVSGVAGVVLMMMGGCQGLNLEE